MEKNQVVDDKTEKLLFGEYQLIRETAIHFDKILLDIRKIVVTIAFIIFGLAVETFRVENVLYGLEPIDLAIVFTVLEFLMVLIFFYLERHYRMYLVEISELAVEYENMLGLNTGRDTGKIGVSKCLECVHNDMGIWERIAHFNVYTFLMAMGFLAFSILMELRIGLSLEVVARYSFFVFIIIFLSFIIYVLRNIKKQKDGEDRMHDDFIVYLVSVVIFIISPYILFFWFSKTFVVSFFGALFISFIIFLLLGLCKNKIEEIISKILIFLNIIPQERTTDSEQQIP
jgi:hypothetical protein